MQNNGRQRRDFLRQALSAGCVLAVPGVLAGCDDPVQQQASAKTGTMNEPEKAAAENSGQDTAQAGKVSKQQAGYQSQPNGEEQCANCQQFNADSGTCNVVQGQVAANGWCTLWVAQA